jgi:hypothetical protein
MMTLIGLNIVSMSLDNSLFDNDLILERINFVFTFVYVFELAINIVAFGLKEYY